ncbi:SH2 domain-containing protein 3C [Osmerus eperlanus]|uniref:SH2 domain-containing protein 3C n=1 Tax=Osmerus eperlanus TaxID=29151 RepID=UPI002E1057CB
MWLYETLTRLINTRETTLSLHLSLLFISHHILPAVGNISHTMSKKKLSFKWFESLSNLSFRRSSDKSDAKSSHKHHGDPFPDTHPVEATTAAAETTVDDLSLMRPRTASYAQSSNNYTHIGTLPRLLRKRKEKSTKKVKEKERTELKRSQSQKPAGDHVTRSRNTQEQDQAGPQPDHAQTDAQAQAQAQTQAQAQALIQDQTPLVCQDKKQANCGVEPQSEKLALSGGDAGVLHTDMKEPAQSPSSSNTQGSFSSKPPRYPALPRKTLHPRGAEPRDQALPRTGAGDLGTETSSRPLSKEAASGWPTVEQDPERVIAEDPERQTTEAVGSHMEPTDCPGEYVEFSKEKYLLESPPEKLRKELEEELKLSPSDIRSHGWYHGHLPPEVSETLVVRSGDFLVRDSLVNVGDYVLTCRWEHETLHFKITKVLVKSSETKVQYLLERDSFDSIPELIRFYIGNRRPVSQTSPAQIFCPISRTLPLRYLEATFALANSRHGPVHSPSSPRGAYIKRRSVTMTDGLTTEKMIPHSPSTIHHHKDAMRNCAMSLDQIQEYRCALSPIGDAPLSPAYSHITRHRSQSGGRVLAVVPPSPILRRSSDPQLSPSSNNNLPCLSDLPPSTSSSAHSTPAHARPHHHAHQSEACDKSGSYCDLRPSPAPAVAPSPPAKSYVERLRVEEGRGQGQAGEEEGGVGGFSTPQMEMASWFRPGQYQSAMMPLENKPLEMGVLKRVKELLAEVDARTTAKHITMADCTVARILGVTKEMQKTMGVGSGLELLTLPHGHQLRLDLLERFYTMSIMTAVDLLGCTGSTEERAALLHKIIQLAAELKSSLGNMFGFAAVMRALELPQISRLEQTWMTLRQRHTEGAILYEKKLKPFMKNMNDGKESPALNSTSFPHVVPLLSLLERGVATQGEGLEPWESVEAGVDVVMCHLEAARTIAHHGGIYRSNAEAKLQGFQERGEVLEIFQTEFQMRLLWGSRGSEGSQAERYDKFDKVLTALSHKLEPPVRHSEL